MSISRAYSSESLTRARAQCDYRIPRPAGEKRPYAVTANNHNHVDVITTARLWAFPTAGRAFLRTACGRGASPCIHVIKEDLLLYLRKRIWWLLVSGSRSPGIIRPRNHKHFTHRIYRASPTSRGNRRRRHRRRLMRVVVPIRALVSSRFSRLFSSSTSSRLYAHYFDYLSLRAYYSREGGLRDDDDHRPTVPGIPETISYYVSGI